MNSFIIFLCSENFSCYSLSVPKGVMTKKPPIHWALSLSQMNKGSDKCILPKHAYLAMRVIDLGGSLQLANPV